MPIQFACVSCGKQMKAPDSAAGKAGRCPFCGTTQNVPYGGIPEAVPVAAPGPEYAALADDADYKVADQPASPATQENRRPCPMCGEMILTTAVKCRFCGEVFDTRLREATHVDPELVRRFRREVQGLGGIWIFFGCIWTILAFFAPAITKLTNGAVPMEASVGIAAVFFVIGVSCLTAGIFACLKHLWAVYFGLVVSYVYALLTLVGSFSAKGNAICPLVIAAVIIVQAHRTIGWANKMKKAGIPLNIRPEQIRARV